MRGDEIVYKNKNNDGTLNLCGKNIKRLRQALVPAISQSMLADRLQLLGLDLDKNAIQRIESGQRFVTDIELAVLAQVFDTSVDELLK